MYFRNLVLSAFTIAVLTGLLLSAYQAIFITPIIINAEVYEVSMPINSHHNSEHLADVWEPASEVERHSWNFISNFLLCFGYALVLLSVMSMKTVVTFSKGIFWGIAAYLSIFVAPALGLPPEIPGMETALLEGRQAWWLFTVILTAIGLWFIVFNSYIFKCVGVLLVLLPHLMGAPQPEYHGFVNTNPEAVIALTELWHDFILHTSLANALLWVILGGLSGFVVEKFIYSIDGLGEKCV